jgi:hypothetical protein
MNNPNIAKMEFSINMHGNNPNECAKLRGLNNRNIHTTTQNKKYLAFENISLESSVTFPMNQK